MAERPIKIMGLQGGHNGKILMDVKRIYPFDFLNPFFKEHFRDHTEGWGGAGDIRSFCQEEERSIRYSFPLQEFAEAFFGRYMPNQIVDFMKPIMEEDELSHDFLGLIKNFEKKHQIVIPFFYSNKRGFGGPGGIDRYYLFPLNIQKEKLDNMIESCLNRSSLPPTRHKSIGIECDRVDVMRMVDPFFKSKMINTNLVSRPLKQGKGYLGKLREEFIVRDPKIVICSPRNGRRGALDNFSLFGRYYSKEDKEMPLDLLIKKDRFEIVRGNT
jgi:hypothetical protein